MKRVCALIILLSMVLCACASKDVEQNAPALLEPVQAQPEIAVVQREDVANITTQSCTVVHYSEGVFFEVDGTLEEINVLPGQTVQEGEVLAVLEVESLQEQLDDLLEQRSDASTNAALTNRNLEINIEICQLNLDELVKANAAEISQLQQDAEQLQKNLDEVNQQITTKKAELSQLDSPNTAPTEQNGSEDQTTEPTEDVAGLMEALQGQIAELEQQAAELSIQIDEASVQLEKMKTEHSVNEQLMEMELKDAKLALSHAKENQSFEMESLDDSISTLQNKIENAAIYAPFDGVVTWVASSAYTNGWFSTEDPVLYISDMEQASVSTDRILARQLETCEKIYAVIGGQEYVLTPQEASAQNDISKTLNGVQLSTLFSFADENVEVNGTSGLLYCQYGYRENVLCVPSNALYRDEAGYYVNKMVDGQRERTSVEIGLVSALRVEIISGVEEGDVVYVTE